MKIKKHHFIQEENPKEEDYPPNRDEHDSKVQYYNDHKVLFDGWHEVKCSGHITNDNGAYVNFKENSIINFWTRGGIVYEGECSVQLLKMIFKSNGIEL